MTDLETEATTPDGMTTFEHFGQTWSVPVKRHLSHIRAMKAELRAGFALGADFLAELFLGEEQFAELLELDPDEDAMSEFGTKVAQALGMSAPGNSSPS